MIQNSLCQRKYAAHPSHCLLFSISQMHFISEASIDGLSVAVKNKLRCHSPRFRLSETSFKMLKCYFDFLQSCIQYLSLGLQVTFWNF